MIVDRTYRIQYSRPRKCPEENSGHNISRRHTSPLSNSRNWEFIAKSYLEIYKNSSVLFHCLLLSLSHEYQFIRWRYSQHNSYIGLKSAIWDSRYIIKPVPENDFFPGFTSNHSQTANSARLWYFCIALVAYYFFG